MDNPFMNQLIKSTTGGKYYVYNWMYPFIQKLNNEDRMKLLSQRNIYGESCLQMFRYHSLAEKINKTMALYPEQKSKEAELLARDNQGLTPFMNVFESPAVGHIMWENIERLKQNYN